MQSDIKRVSLLVIAKSDLFYIFMDIGGTPRRGTMVNRPFSLEQLRPSSEVVRHWVPYAFKRFSDY